MNNDVQFSGRVGSTQEVVRGSETTETQNENVRVDVSRKLKIEVNQLREKNEQLKARLEQRTTDWQIAEKKARMYGSRAADLNAKYDAVNAYTKEAGDELCEVHAELVFLRKQMKEAHKRLQDEARARIELEGNIQRLRCELTFKEKFHSEEINELRTRLSAQYEATLQELRVQFEGQMSSNRAEINIMKSRIIELEATNATLNARNYDLEKLLDNERARHVTDFANMEAELQLCRDEMAQQLQESTAYDKLLCVEEDSSQTEWVVTSREDDIEISKGYPKARVQQKGEVQIDGGATVSQMFVTDSAQEPPTKIMMKPRKWKSGENIKTTLYNANEEVAGADRVKRRIIRHVSNHSIINEESSSAEKNPPRRKWLYHVFHRGKKSHHPYWLLKVLGAIT
ncbi:lamin Dm0-like [Musca autumnalis]|uniref:lamin Dm0-like n=1 Tax=Musca autumnalis TaxID=221902 RepID=UPI003CF4F5D1